jgi:hypothetical protein
MSTGRVNLPGTLLILVLAPAVLLGVGLTLLQIKQGIELRDRLTGTQDSTLAHAADLALQVCERNFEKMLDLRLEDDKRMIEALKADSVKQISDLSDRYVSVEYLVLAKDGRVLLDTSKIVPAPMVGLRASGYTETELGDTMVRMSATSFPFFGWTIGAFMTEEDYSVGPRSVLRESIIRSTSVLAYDGGCFYRCVSHLCAQASSGTGVFRHRTGRG